jgi:hypothetical protein
VSSSCASSDKVRHKVTIFVILLNHGLVGASTVAMRVTPCAFRRACAPLRIVFMYMLRRRLERIPERLGEVIQHRPTPRRCNGRTGRRGPCGIRISCRTILRSAWLSCSGRLEPRTTGSTVPGSGSSDTEWVAQSDGGGGAPNIRTSLTSDQATSSISS